MKRSYLFTLVLIIMLSAIGINRKNVEAKDTYMTTRYKRIEKLCEEKYRSGMTQYEMNVDSNKEFKVWNKELTKVYKKEIKKLTKKKAKVLKKAQKKWKKMRIKYAKKSAAPSIEGSIYPLEYNMALTHYTKKRIKKLIKKYGDVGDF